MVKARTEYIALADLDDFARIEAIRSLIDNAHLICGFTFVEKGDYKSAMINSTRNYLLKSGYGNLTEAELILALYYNTWPESEQPEPIKFEMIDRMAETFNVHFYSRVLINYTLTRKLLDDTIAKLITEQNG